MSHHIAAQLAHERQRDLIRAKRSSGLFRRRDRRKAERAAEDQVQRAEAVRVGAPGQRPGHQAQAAAGAATRC